MRPARTARRAMEQLNVPFRMHGRIAGKALDCVGLTSHAAEVPVPSDYQLRGDFERRILTFMNRHEFALCDGGAAIRPGDILLVKQAQINCILWSLRKMGWCTPMPDCGAWF